MFNREAETGLNDIIESAESLCIQRGKFNVGGGWLNVVMTGVRVGWMKFSESSGGIVWKEFRKWSVMESSSSCPWPRGSSRTHFKVIGLDLGLGYKSLLWPWPRRSCPRPRLGLGVVHISPWSYI